MHLFNTTIRNKPITVAFIPTNSENKYFHVFLLEQYDEDDFSLWTDTMALPTESTEQYLTDFFNSDLPLNQGGSDRGSKEDIREVLQDLDILSEEEIKKILKDRL